MFVKDIDRNDSTRIAILMVDSVGFSNKYPSNLEKFCEKGFHTPIVARYRMDAGLRASRNCHAISVSILDG